MDTVLSLFTGAGLLDRGFTQEGFFVASAGDSIWGQDVREFAPASHFFKGVIGGPPCPDFSKARRTAPTGYGLEMVYQFARIVNEAQPDWFLMENVPGVPCLSEILLDWKIQRFNLNSRECGLKQNRLRCFQFSSRDASRLLIHRCVTNEPVEKCCLASEGKRGKKRRTFADFCELQGLPRDFLSVSKLPLWLKYQMVGNGVPVPMARVIARAIRDRHITKWARLCVCDCGREVKPGTTLATAACRKRMQRERDAAGVKMQEPVTLDLSL